MKHYFSFADVAVADTTQISSPVAGTVAQLNDDGGHGLQIWITPTLQPAFSVILFHVTLTVPLAVGGRVGAGQLLGTFAGGTLADVAVGVQTPQGFRLVSWFNVTTEALFQEYRARGVVARDDLIISQAARDADPLACDSDAFRTFGTTENWVMLH